MSVKEQTLRVLENNREKFISGEELAQNIGVSRNAVWKAIKSLQDEGYKIVAVTHKGYCLCESNDIISEQSILKYLPDNMAKKFDITVFKTINSTNTYSKELALKGEKEGTVIISEEQTQGRGRQGKSFYSPSKSGIYMSIILRPELSASESLLITTSAAVAVAKAIEDVSKNETKIKWVNDVFCNGKKVSGILTEASFNIESGGMEFVVLGIGINVNPPDNGFPKEIENIASSVFVDEKTKNIRSRIVAEILTNFWEYYENIPNKDFINEYRKRSLISGKAISVVEQDALTPAMAIDIDDDFGLMVEFKDGSKKTLTSGEVSIKI